MAPASAHLTKVAFAGDDFIARREVFDALVAGGGSLSLDELTEAVRPYLVSRLGGEVSKAGGLEEYLETKLASFAGDMVSRTEAEISLVSGYFLMAPSAHHAGGQAPYVAGTQRKIDYVGEVDVKIRSIRTRHHKKWDCLLPVSADVNQVEAVRRSLATFGWDVGRPVLADASGVHIDGRMRLREYRAMHGKRAPKPNGSTESWDAWEGKGHHVLRTNLRPAQGLIRSFDENCHRCTDDQVEAYRQRLSDEGIDLDRLRSAVEVVTERASVTLSAAAIDAIELPGSGLQVSVDGAWVQLRSIIRLAAMGDYNVGPLAKYLMEHGYTVTRRQTRLSMGREAILGNLDDVIEVVSDPTARTKIWPQGPHLGDKLATQLPALEGARAELHRAVLARGTIAS